MGADNNRHLKRLRFALIHTIQDYLKRQLPLRRIVLVASLLKNCDITISPHADQLIDRIKSEQRNDGGWVDCEDTAWCLSCLAGQNHVESEFNNGCIWLEAERGENDGWGFCARDDPSIPITALIVCFLPILHSFPQSLHWLEKQWHKDLQASVNLNYKGAWYLLSFCRHHQSTALSRSLFDESVDYLIREQRENGGWGPWKNHPAPEECFITGICMGALALSYGITGNVKILSSLRKGLGWIKEAQLESGLFPTHYIEEGSAWVFWGWSKALAALEESGI